MKWELIDHGLEHAQFFQGVGTSGTPYDHAVTGVGTSYFEALDDALEQIAEEEGTTEEVEAMILEIEKEHRPRVNVPAWMMTSVRDVDCPDPDDDCEKWYYISIRWR
jgi:hypothetical protein